MRGGSLDAFALTRAHPSHLGYYHYCDCIWVDSEGVTVIRSKTALVHNPPWMTYSTLPLGGSPIVCPKTCQDYQQVREGRGGRMALGEGWRGWTREDGEGQGRVVERKEKGESFGEREDRRQRREWERERKLRESTKQPPSPAAPLLKPRVHYPCHLPCTCPKTSPQSQANCKGRESHMYVHISLYPHMLKSFHFFLSSPKI